MEDILIRSPRASLASDLYDLSLAMDVENGEGPVSGKRNTREKAVLQEGRRQKRYYPFMSG